MTESTEDWLVKEAEWMSHMPSFYSKSIVSGCEASGLAADSLNLIVLLLLSALFGHFWAKLRSPVVRQFTGLLFSLFTLFSAYGWFWSGYCLGFLVIGWIFIKMRTPKVIIGYIWVGLLATFGYFWMYHYHSWRMDVSTTFMGFMCRFSFLAWDQYDMDQLRKNPDKPLSEDKKINTFRMEHKLDRDLSFYDYLCYMLFWVHLLCGSNMPTMDYFRLINFENFKRAGFDPAKDELPTPEPLMIVARMGEAIIHAVVYVVMSGYFTAEMITSSEMNPLFTSFLISICVLSLKQRYHFIWHLLHVSLLTTGAGFQMKTDKKTGKKKVSWRKHWNINSFASEFAEKGTHLTFNWNMTVNVWLKYYFLDRLTMGSWSVKLLMTRAAASIFHGMHSGYHVFFSFTVLHSLFVDDVFDWIFGGTSKQHIEAGNKAIAGPVKAIRCILNAWIVNACGNSLVWYHASVYLPQNWKQMWIPHLICVACAPLQMTFVSSWKRKRKKAKAASAKDTKKTE